MNDRRNFIAATASVAAAALLPAAASDAADLPSNGVTPVSNYPKLVHHVFFWLKNPGSKEDLEKLLTGLRTLSRIETVRGAHFGVPASTEKRDVVDNSWSASEILFFDDTAGQKTYQDHPIHKQFVADCSHLWEKVVVYDAIAS
ncbi:MAG TPA: Dabb family protein [Steroidobacteraceae bacterium]